jgi:Putative beta barrel porin-7 (BBP7)
MAAALTATLASNVRAQENLPFGPSNYEQDFQLFAPFDVDLDNMVDDQWSGYFLEYNKLFWSYSGERYTVGSPNVTEDIDTNGDGIPDTTVMGQFAEIIYFVDPITGIPNPQDEFDPLDPPPTPHLVRNSLTDVAPDAGFAMGNRYEIGYRDQGHGWLLGVLDGPELNQTQFYGFARVDTNGDGIPDGLPPFKNPDYTDGSDIANDGTSVFDQSNGPVAGGDLRAFGWGAVPVLFETPAGYLFGFRDYLNLLAGAALGTQVGPMAWVGNYGASSEDDEFPVEFFRLTDDIDEDGTFGGGVVVDADGNVILVFTDFDDLHEFNIFFDSVLVRNNTETDGVELMWTHDLTNNHYQAKHQNNRLSIAGGARFLRLYDQFRVDAEGSILGRSFWDTSFTNQIVGPQVALRWENQRQRWRLSADSRFMFGYNTADWDQVGLMGEELMPGAVNRPLYARPTAFSHGEREQEFSPVAELRVQASYHVWKGAALKFGYTGSYIGNIRRAAPSVRYFLPDMGYVDTDGEDFLINGFDLGVEFIY